MALTHYIAYTRMKNKLHLFELESRTPTCGQGTTNGTLAFFSSESPLTLNEMADRAYEVDQNICKKCFKINFVEMEAN